MNLHLSGVCLYNKDSIIVFIQTDFPEPVVPAIKKMGHYTQITTIWIS